MKKERFSLAAPLFHAALIGVGAGVVLCLYKFLAGHAVSLMQAGYALLRAHVWFVLPVLAALFGMAFLYARIYRAAPSLKGGGIPLSICAIKGLTPLEGTVNLVGVFCLSLGSFLMGVPLGTEGPCVQMGTAVGDLVSRLFSKKERSAALTSGASAGFTVATGAPISGVLFAVEEAHKKVDAKILSTTATAVLFAALTNRVLCLFLNIRAGLFDGIELPTLTLSELWLPLVVGVLMGLFSVVFLRCYRLIARACTFLTKRLPHFVSLFAVFALTLAAGLLCGEMVSTGHDLVHLLTEHHYALWLLALILLVRITLTLSANSLGVTGGIFLPLLAIGAAAASLLPSLGIPEEYRATVVMLGMVGCVAGMMKMPLTALVFGLEALSLTNQLLPVMLTAVPAFVLTELCRAESITDLLVAQKEAAAAQAEIYVEN